MKIDIEINEDSYSQLMNRLLDREEEKDAKKRIIQAKVLNKICVK
jgi:hypothetical protein